MPFLKTLLLSVRSLDIDYNEVYWKIRDTQEEVLDYTFQILRSESQMGPFDPISPQFQDRFLFVDSALPPTHRNRMLFYKLRIRRLSDDVFEDSDAVQKEPEVDLVTKEMQRFFQLQYQEFLGRRCWLLPVRTFGQRCENWNAVLDKHVVSGCKSCYDTSFLRGYLAPIEVYAQLDPVTKATQITATGPTHQNNTTVKMGIFPRVKPFDIIVEPENKRWRVVDVSNVENVRVPVFQQFTVHEIPPRDIEYDIEIVPTEVLRDLWLSPSRNFMNPFNADEGQNYDEEAGSTLFTLSGFRL